MADKNFLSIGILSRQSRVNVETVRYYERIGLLASPPRSAGGYRMYSSTHVERLRFVRRARDLGLSIDEVRQLLGLADQKSKSCSKVRDLGAHHLADIGARIADLKRMERVLSRLVDACSEGELTDCPLLELWRSRTKISWHDSPPAGDNQLEHIPFGWNQPNGICLLQRPTPGCAFPVRWNRSRFHLTGNRSSFTASEI